MKIATGKSHVLVCNRALSGTSHRKQHARIWQSCHRRLSRGCPRRRLHHRLHLLPLSRAGHCSKIKSTTRRYASSYPAHRYGLAEDGARGNQPVSAKCALTEHSHFGLAPALKSEPRKQRCARGSLFFCVFGVSRPCLPPFTAKRSNYTTWNSWNLLR